MIAQCQKIAQIEISYIWLGQIVNLCWYSWSALLLTTSTNTECNKSVNKIHKLQASLWAKITSKEVVSVKWVNSIFWFVIYCFIWYISISLSIQRSTGTIAARHWTFSGHKKSITRMSTKNCVVFAIRTTSRTTQVDTSTILE